MEGRARGEGERESLSLRELLDHVDTQLRLH